MNGFPVPPHQPEDSGVPDPGTPGHHSKLGTASRSFFRRPSGPLILGLALGVLSFTIGFSAIRPHLPYWMPVLAQPITDRPAAKIGTKQNEAGAKETYAALADALSRRDSERYCEFLSDEAQVMIGGYGTNCVNLLKDAFKSKGEDYFERLASCKIESLNLSYENRQANITLRACSGVDKEDRATSLAYIRGRWVLLN